ncbi:unnamed protein product [Haemonchus placei]|uniref:Uncharacterized protein n=1 Tax=Haemonchus placei TaxID=6290 RepID=A0A0N4W699_HAEPC|nr:unnamed protein product [Haemonchus placei]
MCAHIRRSDFVELEVATDLHKSIRDMESIALQQRYPLGDVEQGSAKMGYFISIPFQRAFFSTNTEGIDFYVASQACGAMLITAPTSTFGWWLAFFTPKQNAVFYSNDRRRMADKVPQKDLFLYVFILLHLRNVHSSKCLFKNKAPPPFRGLGKVYNTFFVVGVYPDMPIP